MSPPPAGRRTAPGRIVDALRRRLRGPGRALPATVPGLGSGEETAIAAAAQAEPDPDPPAEPEAAVEPGVRIDAARARLRAKIEPPDPGETD